MTSLSIYQQSFKQKGTIDSFFKPINQTNNNQQTIEKVKQFNPFIFKHSGIESKKGDKYGSPEKIKTYQISFSYGRYKIHLPKTDSKLHFGGIYCFENTENGKEYWGSVRRTYKGNCFRVRFKKYEAELNSSDSEKIRNVIEAIRTNPKAFKLHIVETFDHMTTKSDVLARESSYILRRSSLNSQRIAFKPQNGFNASLPASDKNLMKTVNGKLTVAKAQSNRPVPSLIDLVSPEKKIEVISLDSPSSSTKKRKIDKVDAGGALVKKHKSAKKHLPF